MNAETGAVVAFSTVGTCAQRTDGGTATGATVAVADIGIPSRRVFPSGRSGRPPVGRCDPNAALGVGGELAPTLAVVAGIPVQRERGPMRSRILRPSEARIGRARRDAYGRLDVDLTSALAVANA